MILTTGRTAEAIDLRSMTNFIRAVFSIVSLAAVLSGCMFSALEGDLDKLDRATHLFAGTVTTPADDSSGIVVVAMHDDAGKFVVGFRMIAISGPFEIRADKKPTWLFAFADANHDLIFQADELYAWANCGAALDPALQQTADISIDLATNCSPAPEAPRSLIDEPLENKFGNYVKLNVGTISSLDSPLFSMEQAEKGLWEPFDFTEDGGAGIHFLEEYDPNKIPVLFVHGINGTPRNFRTLIDNLDSSRYQAWVVSYPSGMRLSWIARGVYQIMQVLHVQHDFDEMHIIAHSMGGLVSKGTLNICAQNYSCKYLSSYITISTPWNGVASAVNGTKWSPTVVPVWWDMVPSSDYVTTLFDISFPEGLTYHLLFGYRRDRLFGAESGDGVVALTSQLRHDAQRHAESIFGYNEGHVSILDSDATLQRIGEILGATQ